MAKRNPPPEKTPGDPADDHPSFEEAMAQVEAIIERIEGGEIGLEESIASYERGVELLRRCRAALEQAEQRVEDLTERMHREADAPADQQMPGEAPDSGQAEDPQGDGAGLPF